MPARSTTVRFSFGELTVLEEDLGEVTIDEGVEIDMVRKDLNVITSTLSPAWA